MKNSISKRDYLILKVDYDELKAQLERATEDAEYWHDAYTQTASNEYALEQENESLKKEITHLKAKISSFIVAIEPIIKNYKGMIMAMIHSED